MGLISVSEDTPRSSISINIGHEKGCIEPSLDATRLFDKREQKSNDVTSYQQIMS